MALLCTFLCNRAMNKCSVIGQPLFECRHLATRLFSEVSRSQAMQMKETIVLVDSNDKVLGEATKEACHRRLETGSSLLHRAFSVFLFNDKNELLLQQRSSSKITFPNYYTNTCCSHPRYTETELDERDNIGIKRAAQRRLLFELGITNDEVPLQSLNHLTRVHYFAHACDSWAEHEIDHVLFCRATVSPNNFNTDEVQNVMFLDEEQLARFVHEANSNGVLITPWFRFIHKYLLVNWWRNIDGLSSFEDNRIHRAGDQT